jgi:HlyD family secretion protein
MKPIVKKIALAGLGLVLLGLFGFSILRSGPLAPIPVTLAEVGEGRLTPVLSGIGVVEARRAYPIGPISPGRVKLVRVDVGDTVAAGQVLAEMDPVDLDDKVAASRAALARAESTRLAAQSQVDDAGNRLHRAMAEAKRYEDLGQKQFVSPSLVEGRQLEEKSARAALQSAHANAAGATQEIARIRAELAAVQTVRNRSVLTAPVDGVVVARQGEPGMSMAAGQPLVEIVAPLSIWLKVRLDQSGTTGLANGMPATITLRSQPGVAVDGQVARVDLQGDSVTEERVVYVRFDSLPHDITLGELAEVSISLGQQPVTLLLPNAALHQREGNTGVWVVHDDGLRFAPVDTGLTGPDGTVQILAGLKKGEKVVRYSNKPLSADSRIKIVETSP